MSFKIVFITFIIFIILNSYPVVSPGIQPQCDIKIKSDNSEISINETKTQMIGNDQIYHLDHPGNHSIIIKKGLSKLCIVTYIDKTLREIDVDWANRIITLLLPHGESRLSLNSCNRIN